ncbi:MAG: cell division topological specificity factor MinE [Anaerolineales bacterium]|jgi:cell division topological specificity factor
MSFLNGLRRRRRTATTAKDRLRLVLIHDRAGLTPGKLEALKNDLIKTLSRHVEIDTQAVRVSLTSDRQQQRLVADIPLTPLRSRRHKVGGG